MYKLGCLSSTQRQVLVVTLFVVSEREESVVALHLPKLGLKTRSGLEPVPISPLEDDIATAPSGPVQGRKEGNVLFNDALNTFCLRLYGVRHMVKDHSDCERGNPLSD